MAAPSMQMNDDNPYKQFQHDLFFTGDNHPRHGFANVGQLAESGEMVRWQYNTQNVPTEADATTLINNGKRDIAKLTWSVGNYFGTFWVDGMRNPDMMSHLRMVNRESGGYLFRTRRSGRTYEWRRSDNGAYDLYDTATQQLLGRFCYFPTIRQTPAGPIYATFGHLFEDDELVLFAMLSLCVNRWVDYYGLAA